MSARSEVCTCLLFDPWTQDAKCRRGSNSEHDWSSFDLLFNELASTFFPFFLTISRRQVSMRRLDAPPNSCSHPLWCIFNPRPTGGAILSPPLVFLRYLLTQCRYHHQCCSTLSPNNFTHCVKIFKVQDIIVWPQITSEWRHVPPISTENKGLRKWPPRVQF